MVNTNNDEAARHPMAVVVARTGLTPDALRVWERRYGVVAPARGPGGHRLYSDADVARLRLLREATSAGRRIGDVAGLSAESLARLVEEDRLAGPAPAAPGAGEAGPPELVADGLAHVRALDAAALETLLRRGLARVGLRAFIDDVVVPLLHGVGDDWAEGAVSIAQEHMASALVQDVLAEVMRASAGRGESPAGVVVLATPSGERHGIGVLLAGAVAATAGWSVIDLGVDLPSSEIAAAAMQASADLVALSVTTSSAADAAAQVRAIAADLPSGTQIVVGGAAPGAHPDLFAQSGARVLADIADFEALLAAISESARPLRRS